MREEVTRTLFEQRPLAPQATRGHLNPMPSFVSEPIQPVKGTFDAAGMSRGEPGVPLQFRWRKKTYAVANVLETWKEHGDCRNGSHERYVRKHGFRIRTTEGEVFRIYFQRTVGRGKMPTTRWWLHTIESPVAEAALRLVELHDVA